jgi:hypothetical protein
MVVALLISAVALYPSSAGATNVSRSRFSCPTKEGAASVRSRYDRENPLTIVSRRLAAFRERRPLATEARIDAFLRDKLCVVRVDSGSRSVRSRSVQDDLTWRSPVGIYYDGQNNYAIASWKFWLSGYMKDWTTLTCVQMSCERDIGGLDAVGLALNRKAIIPKLTSTGHPYNLTTWADGAYFGSTHYVKYTADVNSAVGVGFSKQDRMHADCGITTCTIDDYTMANGNILLFFNDYGSGCHDYQAFFKYGHNWSTTKLAGLTISTSSVGISFSSEDYKWRNATLSGYARLC